MMSYPRSLLETRDDRPTEDHVLQIDGATWDDYERFLEIRGERSVPRISYLEGRVEFMTPSRQHERIKSLIGCLVEAYCLHAGIHVMPYGSWTVKQRTAKSGAEPDEVTSLAGHRQSAGSPTVRRAAPPGSDRLWPICGRYPATY